MAELYDYVAATGVIVEDTATLKTDVENEYKSVYGQGMTVTPDTQQGAQIVAETSARRSVVQTNAQVANQINPNQAGGVFLDAICAFLGLERRKATFSRIDGVMLTGQPQTPIQPGSLARSVTGDIFALETGVVLDATGNATGSFVAVVAGPIACAALALNKLVDMVLGWEGVSNPAPATPGSLQESDESLRQRRNVTLARQGISTREAQVSGLYDLPDVHSLQFRENYTDTDATIDGIFLKKHSVWACVKGGSDQEIARSLLKNKTDGANWNGPVTVPVVDPASGQTYQVKFERPADVEIFINVTVSRGSDTSNPVTSVPEAIVNYANGLIPNDAGLVTGVDVSPFEFGAAINYYHPGMLVRDVKIFKAGQPPASASIVMALNQKPFTQYASVTVTIV